MKKALLVLVVLVALVIVLTGPSFASPAEASGRVCPSPGTGNVGALNMVTERLPEAMGNASENGFEGMGIGVTSSGSNCPSD